MGLRRGFLGFASGRGLKNNAPVRAHVAEALYQHFTTRESVQKIPQSIRKLLHGSPIKKDLCEIVAENRVDPGMSASLHSDMETFCRRKLKRD
jgi:hypothetical protein